MTHICLPSDRSGPVRAPFGTSLARGVLPLKDERLMLTAYSAASRSIWIDHRPDDQTRRGRYEKLHSGNRNIAGLRIWRFHRDQWGSYRGIEKRRRYRTGCLR